MTLTFYDAAFSPNALRTRAVLHELELGFETVEIDVASGANKTAAFLAINPNGKVPAIRDGELSLWESRAINAYLSSLRPEYGLYPVEPQRRALVDQWSYWQAIHLGPAMQKIAFERVQKPALGRSDADETSIAGERATLAQLLPLLDAGLAGRDWIAGKLSVADFALASTFMLRRPAGISLDHAPAVAAWISRLEARPAWQTAMQPYRANLAGRGIELT
jgi:glutathione S-transferase